MKKKFIDRLFKGSKMSKELRVGDNVRCVDGSCSFGIKNGQWDWNISYISGDGDNLRVLKTNLSVGRAGDIVDFNAACDILVTDDRGGFWFVQSCLCKLLPIMHTITIDGKDIEISDESFENLKRQLA